MATVLENVSLNEEGFMTNSAEWTKEIAAVIAVQEGIETLTAEHWKIIDFCRMQGEATGKSPTLRQITHWYRDFHQGSVYVIPERTGEKSSQDRWLGKTGRLRLIAPF
jgi:TusE/DsrC/DsvC family sulfur relay protein